MEPRPNLLSIIDAEDDARTHADQELQGVLGTLKEARKCLRRDWEHLTPRERSAQSRAVKELERQKQALEYEIKIYNSG